MALGRQGNLKFFKKKKKKKKIGVRNKHDKHKGTILDDLAEAMEDGDGTGDDEIEPLNDTNVGPTIEIFDSQEDKPILKAKKRKSDAPLVD